MFGSSSARLPVETAIGTTLPPRTCAIVACAGRQPICTSLVITAVVACTAPGYSTGTTCVPLFCASIAITRWPREPLPTYE